MTETVELPPFCPYVGLVDDRDSHFAFPSNAQRCHASHRPATIELAKQARDCLTTSHVSCSRYRPITAPVRLDAPLRTAAAAEAQAGAMPAVEVLTPVRPAAPRAIRRAVGRRLPSARVVVQLLLFAALLVAVAVGGMFFGGRLADQLRGGGSGPAATSPAVVPASPSAAATSPEPTDTPRPPAGSTASPTATPAPTPTIHVVKSGETLSGIAQRYGVSVASIVAANGLKNANAIVTGQKLVIPLP